MSDTVVETDFGRPPVIYSEGFIKAVTEETLAADKAIESSGGSGSSSSNNSQTHLSSIKLVPLKDVELQDPVGLEKERHPSSSSTGSHSKRKDSAHDQQVEYYCGVGRCRPSWMQRLRDARFFTFLLCLNCFIEGALVSGESVGHVKTCNLYSMCVL